MLDESVKRRARQYFTQGFPEAIVRQKLIDEGLTSAVADEAVLYTTPFTSVTAPPKKESQLLPRLIIFVAIIAIISATFFLLFEPIAQKITDISQDKNLANTKDNSASVPALPSVPAELCLLPYGIHTTLPFPDYTIKPNPSGMIILERKEEFIIILTPESFDAAKISAMKANYPVQPFTTKENISGLEIGKEVYLLNFTTARTFAKSPAYSGTTSVRFVLDSLVEKTC